MRQWFALAITILLTGCQVENTGTPEIPVMETAITTPDLMPECQPNPNVTLKLQRTGTYLVEVIATGLQPGETPYVYYKTAGEPGSGRGFPGEVVGANGEFYSDLDWRLWDVDVLEPPEGQSSVTWEFRLVHARGVECVKITLP